MLDDAEIDNEFYVITLQYFSIKFRLVILINLLSAWRKYGDLEAEGDKVNTGVF